MTWEAEAALQGPGKEGARAEATRGVAGCSEPPPRMRRDRHQAGGAGAAVAAVAAVAAAAAKAADQEGEGVATSGERPQQRHTGRPASHRCEREREQQGPRANRAEGRRSGYSSLGKGLSIKIKAGVARTPTLPWLFDFES